MGIKDAFDASVDSAIRDGRLDEAKHGAIIEAARKLAVVFDSPDWPMVNGKLDNVTPSVFLKYCESLGITPTEVSAQKEQASRLTVLTNKTKFAKASND